MIARNWLLVSATSLCVAWSAGIASAQVPSTQMAMKSPTDVQRALSALNRVVDHTHRLIAAGNFSQLSRENREFNDGSQALERSIANEPAQFKSKVEGLLRKADTESKNLADASTTADATKLNAIQADLATAAKEIFAVFPSNVQPSPPNLAEEREEQTSTTGQAK